MNECCSIFKPVAHFFIFLKRVRRFENCVDNLNFQVIPQHHVSHVEFELSFIVLVMIIVYITVSFIFLPKYIMPS